MSISETFLPEFDQEMATTRKLLERVPDDHFGWKPHEKSFTLGRLASHVAEMAGWAVVTMTTEKLELNPGDKPFNAPNQAELLAAFDANVEKGRTAIAATSDADMAMNWSLVYGGHTVFTQPRAGVLRGMVMNHLIHHRGQLSVYLRLLNVPIPGMYGPSADDKTALG